MPFVSKFSGHGRIPGIHKPAAPPQPSVSNSSTGVTSLTFTIGNYDARWTYTASISPSAGTISFSGATITVSGLNASTSYTITVNASGSGGIRSNTASATTNAPPPFFPPFFPFFPFFPPSFPFFPFFPPSFPFFPFFPGFPPAFPPSFPPSVKTAPTAAMSDIQKVQILTSEYGYLEGKYLTEDDELQSILISGIGSDHYEIGEEVRTKIVNISSISAVHDVYHINDEIYPENCRLLCKRYDIVDFIKVSEISENDKIFNYDEKDFVSINSITKESVSGMIYKIECSPNTFYTIHSSLGYFE